MTKLTKRQQEILNLIQSHMNLTGSPPTRAEIAKTMGFRSPNAAEDHLRALARKGVIELVPGTSRGIRLMQNISGIPIIQLERINAQQPIYSENHIEGNCRLDRNFFSPSIDFLLHFAHKSHAEFNIQEGDYLAIHQTQEVQNGQIVLIREQEITLKRFNAEHVVHPATIEGIVVGVIRSLSKLPLPS